MFDEGVWRRLIARRAEIGIDTVFVDVGDGVRLTSPPQDRLPRRAYPVRGQVGWRSALRRADTAGRGEYGFVRICTEGYGDRHKAAAARSPAASSVLIRTYPYLSVPIRTYPYRSARSLCAAQSAPTSPPRCSTSLKKGTKKHTGCFTGVRSLGFGNPNRFRLYL